MESTANKTLSRMPSYADNESKAVNILGQRTYNCRRLKLTQITLEGPIQIERAELETRLFT